MPVEIKSSLYLFVILSIVDFQIHKNERRLLEEAVNELDKKFNIDDALDYLNEKFRDDFETAASFYMQQIKSKNFQKKCREFMKELVMADSKLHDREITFLEVCKRYWKK